MAVPLDRELVLRWQQGHAEAGTELLRRHSRVASRYFYGALAGAADDLLQQTFLVCTQNVSRIRDPAKFPQFLGGVARRVAFEHLRAERMTTSRRAGLAEEPESAVSTASQVVHLRERHEQLMEAVQALPERWRLTVMLHYWGGRSVTEIAEVQGVPPGTVKSWLLRARRQMRGKLSSLTSSH
ncbi:MAG: RNA polymerase sigma factor [Nannocystales bacterium]